jgi:predicted DNA binding protein
VVQSIANSAHVRYFTLSLQPARGLIHPADDALADASDLTRESLTHISAQNETSMLCYRLRGDPAVVSTVLADRSDVVLYDTIGDGDGAFDLYLRVNESLGTLDECFFEQGLLIDLPIGFVGRGLRVTVIGTSEMVRQTMERLPAEITCSVERLGGKNDDRLLLATLTDRQREVIETAFEMGYYEIPRRTTHADIAATLDRSGSTIDEHLRKAEFRLMEQLLS